MTAPKSYDAKPSLQTPPVRSPGAPNKATSHGQKPKNMNGPLYMQNAGNSNVVLVRRVRRKDASTWKLFTQWMVENQIGLSFNLLALLFLAHYFIPKAQPHTTKFFTLSYYNAASGKYGKGIDDAYMIPFFVVLFTGVRAAVMEYILAPIAKTMGVRKTKQLTRFSEQSWLLVYYSVFWTMGVYIYYKSPYYFLNLEELWTGWPERELGGLNKFYILAQWAFWLQQIFVINIEDRRKDHIQMVTHHFITCGLLYSCYAYHHTRVGNVILVLMDIGDVILAIAKCLKYTGFTTICDVMFGVFMVSWIFARHILYPMVCWSIYAHIPRVIGSGCFEGPPGKSVGPTPTPEGYRYLIEPFFDMKGRICFNPTLQWAFLAPLLMLLCLTFVWFTRIVQVAVKVVRGDGAEDNRSDDEDDEEEEEEGGEGEEYVYEEAQPLEAEVGVEDLDLKNWERRTGHKRPATATGVSLPGHSDRKELLGRIGCEKQVE
ncbi:TLC domain-containing protein [Sodiomyces alkalinus F11]|uniref:TLC domain-containing protein n=1 Tax=Sodiomyces alkalinus (strain CBS 110278 / VKM F-3762 / F11) TaxID=1314773 RepID=A0A3N2Q2S3_SODAK|nr:TLC domain-containing protein [Sodiomyces alkalinus F11]ROT41032.1 TLC domain-containing protein [Sodiomyces alkalinus F11]